MIGWTIEAALASGVFDRVFVSTDDSEIAEIAVAYGADVPFLRDALADDVTPISAVTGKALRDISQREGGDFDVVVQLMANCPLRGSEDIVTALAAFDRTGGDYQISCTKYGWLNPWWAARLDQHGHPVPLFPGSTSERSQDLPEVYCPTGAVWIARASALLESGTFYGPGHRFEPMPWQAAIDIDDEGDLEFALAVKSIQGQSSYRRGTG